MDFVPDSIAQQLTAKLAANPALLSAALADLDGVIYREAGVKPAYPLTLKADGSGGYQIWPTELLEAIGPSGAIDGELSDDMLELVSAGSIHYCCVPSCDPAACEGQSQQAP